MILTLNKGNGKFIYAYNDSAYIISYIFGYKILDGLRCGFPDITLDKVLSTLNNKEIKYEVVNSSLEVIKSNSIDEFNNEKYLNESKEYFEKQKVIEIINKEFVNMDKNELVDLLNGILNK